MRKGRFGFPTSASACTKSWCVVRVSVTRNSNFGVGAYPSNPSPTFGQIPPRANPGRFNSARASDYEKAYRGSLRDRHAPTDARLPLMSVVRAFTEARTALDLSAKHRGKEGIGRMNDPGGQQGLLSCGVMASDWGEAITRPPPGLNRARHRRGLRRNHWTRSSCGSLSQRGEGPTHSRPSASYMGS